MRSPATSPVYDPGIGWDALLGYMRAVRDFTRTPPQRLKASSFDRIRAADEGALPPPCAFERPGCVLRYRRYASASGRRALVMVHGSACFADELHTLARLVSGWDLADVYTLDMRGHGLSDGPRGHAADSPHQMVEDIAAFVARLRSDGAAERIFLGGHSAGGGLVLGVARLYPEACDGYVFLAPYLGLGSPTIRPHFGGWVKLRAAPLLALVAANLFGLTRFNGATVLDFSAEACAREPRYVRSWSFHTLLAFGPGRWIESAPPIPETRPVLLLAGSADECFEHRLYRTAFDTIAPHTEIPDVGACGHWDILVDVKSTSLLGAWLARQPQGRRAPQGAAGSLQMRAS